jgi:hypothetical protein
MSRCGRRGLSYLAARMLSERRQWVGSRVASAKKVAKTRGKVRKHGRKVAVR